LIKSAAIILFFAKQKKDTQHMLPHFSYKKTHEKYQSLRCCIGLFKKEALTGGQGILFNPKAM